MHITETIMQIDKAYRAPKKCPHFNPIFFTDTDICPKIMSLVGFGILMDLKKKKKFALFCQFC